MLSWSRNVRCWQVSELNNYLKDLLASNPFLNNLWIRGEISNLRKPSSGHLYFTLKDQDGTIRAVMFKSKAYNILMPLRDGMEVLLRASLSIYERDGVYQLYVEEVQPLGTGDLHRAFERLKERLEKEGLFDLKRKKPLPRLPLKIGLVTSLTASVLQDMLKIFNERFPQLQIIIAPAIVQGLEAPESICKGVEFLNRYGQVDLIIIGRGGGSLEELWAFNTEIVARSIANSNIPIISAVGHETDFTIADLVADLRAPTPTAAAVMAVPDYDEEIFKLNNLLARTEQRVCIKIEQEKEKLLAIVEYSVLGKPENLLVRHLNNLNLIKKRISPLAKGFLENKNNNLLLQSEKLDSLSPLKVLKRGYGVSKSSKKSVITSIRDVTLGELLELRLQDGYIECRVEGVKIENEWG